MVQFCVWGNVCTGLVKSPGVGMTLSIPVFSVVTTTFTGLHKVCVAVGIKSTEELFPVLL